ncbi:MAG TPA: hypothetical protein VN255_13450, partial [Mycobacterium sp.]|nr:hypothetical protein [Mycobacterium sp.]
MAAAGGEYTGLDELDLARMPFLTELAWGSALLGRNTFAALMGIGDQVAIRLLRWIQRKISCCSRGRLLLPGHGRSRDEGQVSFPRFSGDFRTRFDLCKPRKEVMGTRKYPVE